MPICLSRVKRYSATDTSECALMIAPYTKLGLLTHAGEKRKRVPRPEWVPAHNPSSDGCPDGQEYSKSLQELKVTIESGIKIASITISTPTPSRRRASL